jgi:branched-chain amino acid aminotransferase
VLEWCDEAIEHDAPVEVLHSAQEVFLVSTVRDVQPVHACDGVDYEVPGPVTRRVQQSWAARVAQTANP